MRCLAASLAASILLVLAVTSVSGLPKYYRDTLYKPGGLDHLDATGDESKWGKMVRWILTGKANIPNDKIAKHHAKGGPDGPDGHFGPGGDAPLETVLKPNGRIKTVGPYGPISLDGSVQPTVGVNPDGSIEQIGTDVVVKPDGRLKPVAELINNGGPLPPLGPVNPNFLRPNGPDPAGNYGLETVIKPNGRIKTVGPYGPISLDGSVQPTVGVNPDGSIEQIGNDVVVKPDGRIKPVAELIENGKHIRPLGPVNPYLLPLPNNLDGMFGADRNGVLGPADNFGLDTVIKPNGRIKTVGPYGPISLDGSVQPTVGVNPDGFTEQIGTDVLVKPDGRIKPVAAHINNGKPLGPVDPNVIGYPDGSFNSPDGLAVAVDPFGGTGPGVVVNPDGSVSPAGNPALVPGPYGYGGHGNQDKEWYERYEYGFRQRRRDPYPYVF